MTATAASAQKSDGLVAAEMKRLEKRLSDREKELSDAKNSRKSTEKQVADLKKRKDLVEKAVEAGRGRMDRDKKATEADIARIKAEQKKFGKQQQDFAKRIGEMARIEARLTAVEALARSALARP